MGGRLSIGQLKSEEEMMRWVRKGVSSSIGSLKLFRQ